MKPLVLAKLGLICGITTFVLSACSSLPSKPPEQKSDLNQATNNDNFAELEKKPDSLAPFLEKVSQDHSIPLKDLQLAFDDAKTIPSIKKLVMPPPVGFQKNWKVYRSRFVEPKRLAAGQQFWKKHRTFIEATASKTGVPAEVIVSIIGIETIYGRQTGNFRVKDVLSTLAFSYPETTNKASREQLFKDQLQELILMCWTEAGGKLPSKNSSQGVNSARFSTCLNQNSSYAGAIGLPQFMPSSIRSFAVDGDGDGHIDLKQSPKDAIASVANFMKKHGWQTGMPISFPVQASAISEAKALADGEPQLKYTVQELIEKGILTKQQGDLQSGGVAPQSKAFIVDLPYPDKDGSDQVQYFVGLNNFLTIVQYNRSYFYAQSVAEFAEALGYKNQSVVPIESPAKTSSAAKIATDKSKPKKTTTKKKVKST